jgi:T5SS/PEP-CTERM-associated repeat protein
MNSPAANNRLVVSDGSSWNNSGNFNVGYSGSLNELDVVGESTVTNVYGYIGYNSPSSNNTVLVSDSGSFWRSAYVYLGQSGGANNRLIITNGGQVASSFGVLGTGFGKGNSAIVTGSGSSWANASGLNVGAYGPNSLLIITNGGTVSSGTLSGLGMLGASSVSNLAIVTDAGSAWKINGSLTVGKYSAGNELDILNGAKVTDTGGTIGGTTGGSNNLVLVSGAGSVWSNNFLYLGDFNTSSNSLIITNAGQVYSTEGIVQGLNNNAVINGIGSAWNCGSFLLGNQSPGAERLTINNGGTLIVSNTYDHDYFCNSNLLTLADIGSSLQCKILSVGHLATGNECVVSNGATLTAWATNATVVEGYATRMTITGGGTLWTNAGDLQFGQNSNVLAILNGATVVDTNGYVQNISGSATNKPNTVIIAGPGSLWKNRGSFHVTDSRAQLLITNGGTLSAVQSYFGDDLMGRLDTNCFALVSGPGSLWTNASTLYIGNNGVSNRVVVTDSGGLTAGLLYIGYHGPHNQMIISNSGIVTVGVLMMGSANSYTNSLTLDDGTLLVTNSGISIIKYATLTLNSGLLTTPLVTTDFTANEIILNGGTFQSGGTSYSNTNAFAIGNGTDAATYEMLSEPPGNLGTHSFSGGVVVLNNGLLKGFGTIVGSISVANGGTIAPGSPSVIATNTQRGNLTLNAGATAVMKLDALSGASDSWIGATNLVYGGTLQLATLSGSLAAGNSFKLFGATNYSGAFANLTPATPGAGLRWDTNELNVDGVLRVLSSTTPPPAFGSITTANGNLIITATGGVPYDPCYLLSCTNLPAAPADWSCIATNYFDASGGTSFTNAAPAPEPQRYFRLQVN